MKKNYFSGILGALVGGLIATIPWILTYVYANMIYSILAIFVAMGALKGYQLCKGKIDKKLSTIITLVSLVSITIATLVIIPCLLLNKESMGVSLANLELLYGETEFVSALLKDYAISILFTFLGISGVIASIKKQTAENENLENVKIDLSNGNSKKDRQKVKELFLNEGATSKESAINIDDKEINKDTLQVLINQKIVVKTEEDKYYYEEETEKNIAKKSKKVVIILIVVMLIFLGIIFYLDAKSENDQEPVNNQKQEISREITYTVPDGYVEYEDEENDNGWFYVPKKNLSGYSGYIDVYYIDGTFTYSEETVAKIKSNLESYDGEVLSVKDYKNNKDNQVIIFETKFSEYTDMIYYVLGTDKTAIVEVIDYGKDENIQKDGRMIADSLAWKKNTKEA